MEFVNSLFDTLILVKIVFIVLTVMAFVFGLFLFKQILNMNGIVDFGSSSAMLKSIAILNIIIALCLILTAFVIL
jgi:hypothetical protein